MSYSGWRWLSGFAVVSYCLFAALIIEARPGFHYDEAIDVLAAVRLRHSPEELNLPHPKHTWIKLKGRSFPLMSAEYIGSIKDYICLPLFTVFGPSAELVRLVAVAMGALGILGISSLLARHVSYPTGAAVAWSMAIHPSYLAVTVLDNPGFSPCMGALGLLCFALSAYLHKQTARAAFWIGLTMGFGVWARANYLWFLAAFFAALIISGGRKMLAVPLRQWVSLVAGTLLGGCPFLLYQVISRGGTLSAADALTAPGSLIPRAEHRLIMLAETLLSDGEHRVIWGGMPLPHWQLWLFPLVIGASCLLCFTLKEQGGLFARVAALTFLILTGVFLFSGLPVAEHHLVMLVPIAAVVVALAGWGLRQNRLAAALMMIVGILYVGSATYLQLAALAGLRSTGGIGPWSDGIFALTERLRADFPGREVKVLDWGLQNSVYVLSDGRVQTREIFWDATAEKTDWNGTWIEEIRSGGIFLLNGPQNRQIPAASIGFLQALGDGHPTVRRRFSIPQRSGATFAEVIEIAPNTLAIRPPPEGNLPVELVGFYDIESGGWRWTKRKFSLIFPTTTEASSLTVRINIPGLCIQKLGTITMGVSIGNEKLAPEKFSRPGDYTITRMLPAGWMAGKTKRFDFQLDKTLVPTQADGRELGIIFVSSRLN